MKDLVEMYNDYRTKQTKTIEEAYCLKNKYSVEEFNISVIKLFDWVRLEYKRDVWIASGKSVKHKNLKIMKYSWCETLRKIVSEEPSFSRYFTINEDEISFSDSLTDSDRLEFCRKAVEEMVIVRQDLYV